MMPYWETMVFPPGARFNEAQFRGYKRDFDEGKFFAALAWMRVDHTKHLVGYSTWWWETIGPYKYGDVNCVAVFEPFRGLGVGPVLMRRTFDHINQVQDRRVLIQTIEDNANMLNCLDVFMAEGYFQHKLKGAGTQDYYGDGRYLHYIEYSGRRE